MGVGFALLFTISLAVYLQQQALRGHDMGLFTYGECDVLVTIRMLSPNQIIQNETARVPCRHPPHYPLEVTIGAPPPVDELLWLPMIIGVLGGLFSVFLYNR